MRLRDGAQGAGEVRLIMVGDPLGLLSLAFEKVCGQHGACGTAQ